MTHADAVTDAKRKMRSDSIARRSRIAVSERDDAGMRLATLDLTCLGLTGASVVSGFLAIGEELDPQPLMMRLRAEGHALALPVMQGKGLPLVFRDWKPGDPLAARMWGIREPTDAAPLTLPDVLLVPLLAFDRAGHRLGYGGGFYDRTLAELRSRKAIRAIGLAFATQEVDEVPHLDYDQRLDWVLTPDGPIHCAR